jgi:beta-phosphoglucomutase family hydrolase
LAIRLEELGAVIFDMDGVVTDTAAIHAAAWKHLFDEYLEERSRRTGEPFRPFDIDADYRRYVDGKPRYDGVRDFLRSRGIVLPEGGPVDPPDRDTVRGLGNRKDRYFLEHIKRHGVQPYTGTVKLVRFLQAAGVAAAIISASRNLTEVLDAAGIPDLFDVRVDGVEAERLGLRGKPDPAIFLEAARRLRVDPGRAGVVEDALAGVEAGRRGGFALVIGVDRTGHAEELRARGADVVVTDPGQLIPLSRTETAPEWLREVPEGFPGPTPDTAWLLEVHGFDPLRERDLESWFTVANGRTGTRGSLEEGSEESSPASYVAGIFGSDQSGRQLVSGPTWIRLAPRIGPGTLDLSAGQVLEHRRILDLRQGILFRFWRHRLPSGAEATFRTARYASIADRALLVLEAVAVSGGRPVDLGAPIPLPPETGLIERVGAREEGDRIVATIWGREGGSASFAIATQEEKGALRRVVAVARSARGLPPADGEAEEMVARARDVGVVALRGRHQAAREERWRDADVQVEGDPAAQRALRFALHHLISSGDPESDVASIGARGLTGPGYKGHVFWDTDAFVMPFLIHTHPPTARAHLAYRYRTLPAARDRAASLGYRGALFPWESADTGEDVTPLEVVGPDGRRIRILTGLQEHHISADVAWAAWRYWEATGDEEFLANRGAEMVLETARFWASRSRRGRDGRYHIDRVIGPDEYHVGVRDNAFTNLMARWNLKRGLEVVGLLRDSDRALWRLLARRLGLSAREFRRWATVADGLVDGFDERTLLYEQFAGFFELEDIRVAEIGTRPLAADVVLGPRRVRHAQIVKQADVLMFIHMLPELVSTEVAEANYRYYEPRTSHGSSLGPAIHAAVAARIGRLDEALDYFHMAAAVDLGNAMGNAAQGVHVASMGSLWQAAVMGFAGVRADGPAVSIDPVLPPAWTRLAFPFQSRGTRLDIDVRRDHLEIALDGPASLALGSNEAQPFGPGRFHSFRVGGRWSPLESAQ